MFSTEASAFEASNKSLAETICVDVVSVDLNGLQIGSVLWPDRNRKIQIAIGSCVAVIVFLRMLADDFPMLRTTGRVQSCRSGRTLDLSARKVRCKFRDVSFWFVKARMPKTRKDLMAMSETSDISHDVSFPRSNRGTKSCAYHEGCGKMELESGGVFELLVEIVLHNDWTMGKNNNSSLFSSFSELEQIE